MIKSLTILFLCLLVGELASALLPLPIPGNVLGLALLTFGLHRRLIRLEDVKPATDVLLRHMAFLFIPPGVGLMLYLDLLGRELLAVSAALLLSTLAVLAGVGYLQQKLEKSNG